MNDVPKDILEFEGVLLERYQNPDVIEYGRTIQDLQTRRAFYLGMVDNLNALEEAKSREKTPAVDAATFLDDPYFTGAAASLWPKLREEIIDACSGKYVEAVFTGSIGTGKTTAALWVMFYYLYRLMNLINPHKQFQLDPASEIVFVLQSVTGGTAYTVDYMRLRRMLEASPWFAEHAPHDQERKATITFKNSAVIVQPLPGTETAAIGENVFGGIIDEVNHMKVTQKSSRTADGGTHDQMLENYRSIARRRESRFQRMGEVPGMLCLVGSANYAGQFTDRKRKEADDQIRRNGETNIYIYDKRPWEIQPDDRFSSERFKVFLGDGTRKPRILGDHEVATLADQVHIMEVPADYRNAFEADLSGAVKDIAGIALHGFSNFIPNLQAIQNAFGPTPNIFEPDWCDFEKQSARIRHLPIQNPKAPRYVHVDLALSMDSAAFTMGHVPGFKVVDRGGGVKDTLPIVQLDAMLTIRPPGGSQIPIFKIRKLVFILRDMGYDIRWVSLDGFQSADFIQQMIRARMRSGIVSLDKTPEPYLLTKQLILDGLLWGCPNQLAFDEFSELVWVSQNTKVDHPPDGSKDLADTVAGVAYGLATKREIWVRAGVNPANSTTINVKAPEND